MDLTKAGKAVVVVSAGAYVGGLIAGSTALSLAAAGAFSAVLGQTGPEETPPKPLKNPCFMVLNFCNFFDLINSKAYFKIYFFIGD